MAKITVRHLVFLIIATQAILATSIVGGSGVVRKAAANAAGLPDELAPVEDVKLNRSVLVRKAAANAAGLPDEVTPAQDGKMNLSMLVRKVAANVTSLATEASKRMQNSMTSEGDLLRTVIVDAAGLAEEGLKSMQDGKNGENAYVRKVAANATGLPQENAKSLQNSVTSRNDLVRAVIVDAAGFAEEVSKPTLSGNSGGSGLVRKVAVDTTGLPEVALLESTQDGKISGSGMVRKVAANDGKEQRQQVQTQSTNAKFGAIPHQDSGVKGTHWRHITWADVFPGALYLLFGLTMMCNMKKYIVGRGGTSESLALSLELLFPAYDNLVFTFVILDALELAQAFGMDATFSGVMIGSHKLGTCCGCSIMWSLLSSFPDLWRGGRMLFGAGWLLSLVGSFVFALCGLSTDQFLSGAEYFSISSLSFYLLPVGRFLQGTGVGMQTSLTIVHFGQFAPPEERPTQNLRLFCGSTVGLGVGPLLAGLTKHLSHLVSFHDVRGGALCEDILITSVALPFLQLPFLFAYPSLQDVQVYSGGESSPREGGAYVCCRQSFVIFICLVLQMIRAFTISSLEAADTMLLVAEYGWAKQITAIAVSSVFFLCLLLKLAHDGTKHLVSLDFWLRALAYAAFAGSLLLLPGETPSAPKFLSGSAVLFPTLFMSSGLVVSIMQSHVFAAGSWFDLKSTTLLFHLLNETPGRMCGPPAARFAIQEGGQHSYALQQIAVASFAVILSEVVLLTKFE